jgi:hypothetical protein
MSPAHRPPRIHYLLAGILVTVFLLQSFSASLQKSPVFDEPPHIAAGLSYLETGVFHANLQHPPLLKEMSALFLSAAGIHWPKTALAQMLIRGGPRSVNLEWPIGNNIIHDNGADRVMFWARLPFILLAGFAGVLLYWWGRQLVGSAAALGALFLYALDPTMVAHSFLVTTDSGLAAFTLLFLCAVWRYLRHPGWKSVMLCGLAMGAVLGAKFSGLFMAPVAAFLLLSAILWPAARTTETPDAAEKPASPSPRIEKAGPNSPCPCGSGKKYKKCHGAAGAPKTAGVGMERTLQRRRIVACACAFVAMCVVAVVVMEALYFFPGDPFLYLTGLRKVNADHAADYQVYFHGNLARRFYGYFVAAYLLKEPLAAILLAAAGLVVLWRSKSTPVTTKLFLLLPPAVFLVAMTIFADDMGVRYLIPALPFLHLLGGMGLVALAGRARGWGRYAAAGLCLWLVVAAAGIYPDHLSYFNETACLPGKAGRIGWDGGTRCGPLWLDDSNVDWGQGLKQLRTWMDRHGNGRPLRLAYFGTFPPEGYGLHAENLAPRDLLVAPKPGLYAVSAHMVAHTPALGDSLASGAGAGAWLRRDPIDIVGHAFYIYEVR